MTDIAFVDFRLMTINFKDRKHLNHDLRVDLNLMQLLARKYLMAIYGNVTANLADV